jgi:manganese/iron transport system permease protein
MPLAQAPSWPLPVAAAAVGVACAALSPLVVARRWAFVGEGVSHSGYGGAGLIWLISLLAPGTAFLRTSGGVTLGVAAFSLATALAIGKLTRDRRLGFLGFDAAVGIVLTASLAFGFLARSIYESRIGTIPVEAHSLLFGDVRSVDAGRALITLALAAAVVAGLWLSAKEALSYAFDPELAEIGGVRAGVVHYGLLTALAVVIVSGGPLVGVVLVTALLVLPGATGALAARTLTRLYAVSFATALLAVMAAVLLQRAFPSLPLGPMIVLALVLEFSLAAVVTRLRGRGLSPRS